MGAIFSLNITYYDSFEEYNKEFPNHHYYSFMLNGNSKLKDVISKCKANNMPNDTINNAINEI